MPQIAFKFVVFPEQPVLDEQRIWFESMEENTGSDVEAVKCDFSSGVALLGESWVVKLSRPLGAVVIGRPL